MATIEKRISKDGKITYRVQIRLQDYLISLQQSPSITMKHLRRHTGKWQSYLRVFDANCSGIKRSFAAPKIFVREPKQAIPLWNDRLKQANKMVNSGFRILLEE